MELECRSAAALDPGFKPRAGEPARGPAHAHSSWRYDAKCPPLQEIAREFRKRALPSACVPQAQRDCEQNAKVGPLTSTITKEILTFRAKPRYMR